MYKHQMRDPFADWQIKENKVPEGVPAEGAANRVPEEAPAEKKTGGDSRSSPGYSFAFLLISSSAAISRSGKILPASMPDCI